MDVRDDDPGPRRHAALLTLGDPARRCAPGPRWLPAARSAATGVLAIVLGGCASHADLVGHQRIVMTMLEAQSRALEEVTRDVERLRAEVDTRSPRRSSPAPPPEPAPSSAPTPAETERAARLEERVRELEQRKALAGPIGMTPSPEGMSAEDPAATDQTIQALAARQAVAARRVEPASAAAAAPAPIAVQPSAAPQLAAASPTAPPRAPPSPPPLPVDADWKREVAQDRAVATTARSPADGGYLSALDRLAIGDCAQAMPRLAVMSTGTGGSPHSDNVLYWQARCAALQGEDARAVSMLQAVVARYPKSDKAPAALWEQGRTLIRLGDVPGARVALSKLIRDYPATTEATHARRKLAELEQ